MVAHPHDESSRPGSTSSTRQTWRPAHLAALLAANVGLALGPLLVRLADTGPVAAGFWRLTLAVPIIAALSLREPAEQRRFTPGLLWLVAGGGLFFGIDLASWHVGIVATKLGNASLFGNSGSVLLMAWSLVAARRAPRLIELVTIGAALAGAALLMGGSLEISHASFVGDLFCLLAGVFYAFYILMLRPARASLGQFTVLGASMFVSVPVLLGFAILLGETIWPQNWTPLIALAISSQLVGQGFLIYSLRHFPPLVIGLALLTQPAISAAFGWMVFGETLSVTDVLGMVLVALALLMARASDRG